MKRILFLTGTRADFGKLKPLIERLHRDACYEIHLFVTGMHMLRRYGYTTNHVRKLGIERTYSFINQNEDDSMDVVLAKTIQGLSDYIKENPMDMVVVHGDRVETLAGAIVGALNNTLVAHIEGGEVSGTVDELLRHAVTKMSHLHFVANEQARGRLIRLGESPGSIRVIGSPDIDVMDSDSLPTLEEVRSRYGIKFSSYAILMYHPVTTELANALANAQAVVQAVLNSRLNCVVIYPNNDPGSREILEAYAKLEGQERFRVFPSMRFEYFLTLMKHCQVIIGNSSAGVREAPHYGRPSVNIGSRQHRRASAAGIINCGYNHKEIRDAIQTALRLTDLKSEKHFGDGGSSVKFSECLAESSTWSIPLQKSFAE